MTADELLKPRYEVIANYPHSKVKVGDVLILYFYETSTTGMSIYVTNTENPVQGNVLLLILLQLVSILKKLLLML